MPSESDIAYAAGLLDGEGSIQINPTKGGSGKRYWGLSVQVSSNNHAVLLWLKGLYRGTITEWKSKKSTQGKTSYNWRLYSEDARRFLSDVIEHQRIKKDQAELALAFLTTREVSERYKRLTPEHITLRNEIARKMKELNRLYGKSVGGPFPEGVI